MPWLVFMLNRLPDWFLKMSHPPAAYFREQWAGYVSVIQAVLGGKSVDRSSHVTIFHALRDNPDLPPQEKSTSRLAAEAASFVGAGTLTTAHTLATTTYHVLADPAVLRTLLAELEAADLDAATSPDLQTLEQLPYLTAVIDEGLRISYGVLHRLSRVHPHSALHFQGWTIPPGTPVGMSPIFLHNDEVMFPRPREFEPERWTRASKEKREAMTKRLSNFGHGSRQCVGLNLAYTELYLTLSSFFRRLGRTVVLYETDCQRDVELVHDYFIPAPSAKSRGVRIALK